MVAPIKSALDDGLFQLQVMDMSGGLNTNTGATSLAPNQTPDCLNVIGFPGRLQYRGGFTLFCSLPALADREYRFFDISGTQHLMVWAGGDLYDCKTGTAVLITATVYTAGQQIAVVASNYIMYWATPTVPLRQYDGTTEAAVVDSMAVGSVAPPAGSYLTVYNGQLVMLQPVISSVTYSSSFMWSDVNDATTWIGANIQGVGSADGGTCQWALTLGIPAIVVGKSQGASNLNLFIYTGALAPGSLTQTPISCPVAALDSYSACVVPSRQGLSTCIFIGSDAHFWMTNGVEAWMASEDILALTEDYIRDAIQALPTQKFFSSYYTRWQYYICSIGTQTHFVYRPGQRPEDTPSWWLFEGWPSGDFADFIGAGTGAVPGVFQVAMDQTLDNGVDPTPPPYYTTPYLHGGKIEREKQYQNFALETYDVGVQYNISGLSIPRADGYVYNIDTINFEDPAASAAEIGTSGTWDVSTWGAFLWGGGAATLAQPYQPCISHAPIRVTTLGTIWVPPGEKQPLKTSAAQFKISWAGGLPDFQVLAYNVRYMERSFGFAGNAPYQTAGGIISTTDPYTTTGAE